MSPMSTRRVGVASGLVVALAATSLTFFAVTSKGETVHETDLSDGGVWVSSAKDARFARVNKAVGQFDAGVAASSGPGEPDRHPPGRQRGGRAGRRLRVASRRSSPGRAGSTRRSGTSVPAPQVRHQPEVFVPGTVDLRGGTVAMVDPRTGKRLGPDLRPQGGAEPRLEALTHRRQAAGQGRRRRRRRRGRQGRRPRRLRRDRQGRLDRRAPRPVSASRSPSRSSSGTPRSSTSPRWAPAGWSTAQATTSCGSRAATRPSTAAPRASEGTARVCRVAAARPRRRLRGPAGLDDAAAGRAWVARVPPAASRSPSATTRHRRCRRVRCAPAPCIHAAWASVVNNYYGKDCGSEQPSPAVSIVRATKEAVKSGVSLRTNHGLVVLNDLDGGEVWDLDSKPKKLDEWDSLIPPPQTRQEHQEEGREPHRRDVGGRSPRRPSRTTSRPGPVARPSCTSSTTTPTPPARCWRSTPATSAVRTWTA